jgi:predicted DNA-binding transcriptional regulator YafY
VARDVRRDAWRTLRVDRMSVPEVTGHTFVLDDPPDAAALVAQAIAVNPYRHTARVRVHADAETLAARVPPTVATIERIDDTTSLLTTGAHDLDTIAVHVALLGFDVEVLDPPELRIRMHDLARRLAAPD